jgi:methyl-accepting chemotaxis protein
MTFTKESSVCIKFIISAFVVFFILAAMSELFAQDNNSVPQGLQDAIAVGQKLQDVNTVPIKRKPVGKVQLVSFVLNNGQSVSGRVESEDAFEIKLSQIEGVSIVSSKYYKNEIDKKTVIYKNISELDYWRNTGDYFLQNVWDFQNDPDEFIQAIRCFQRAKVLVADALGENHRLVAELDEKIKKINADMQNWSQQAKTRAEMRNLETLATLDAKLQQFQEQLTENSKAVAELRAELKNISSSSDNYDQLREKVSNADILIRVLEQRTTKLEGDMDSLWRWNRNQPRYYYNTPRTKTDPNSQ